MERLYRRRVPTDKVVTNELARICAELSFETRRQIGLLIDRQGHIQSVIIGNDHELVIPNLARSRSGLRLLRGVRLVHTHLHNQPLTRDDLTDLALLRLDLMMAIGVGKDGRVQDVFLAHLLPQPKQGKSCQEWEPCSLHGFQLDCQDFILSLENECTRTNIGLRKGKESSRAILVSVSTERASRRQEHLDELRELVRVSHIHVVDSIIQRPHALHPKYVLGLGKLKDVIIQALQTGADWLIFDRDLTPAQVHGISEVTELRVLDRTQVILDIFAQRAHSRIGKVQVELAQLRYRLPRLSQSNTAFSRLAGGIGSRGPGETKLETDRRRARDRIRRLEAELVAVSRSRQQQRNMRSRQAIPVVSLVGYTNAGKSTLLNALTGSSQSAKDRVFETLDTVSRRLYIPDRGEIILTDTVGFIRQLPEDLVAAFHTTLQELKFADVLVHVVDARTPDPDRHIEVVESILAQLGFDTIPRLMVLNKCDLLPADQVEQMCHRYRAVGITATQGETVEDVRQALAHMLNRLDREGELKGRWGADRDTRFMKAASVGVS
ncbi:MAG: GTPase HflX [Nitrospirales bacterium]|nr:MAG: GTPase HflX [Nitrospirales bacterium]